jgi:hypothetical protein
MEASEMTTETKQQLCLAAGTKMYAFAIIELEKHRLEKQIEQVLRSSSPYTRDMAKGLADARGEIIKLENFIEQVEDCEPAPSPK